VNLSSLRKWPSEPSEWKRRNKSQSRLPTATPTVDTPDRQRYAVASGSSQFADLDMRGLLAVYRRRCDRAAATLLLVLSRLMSWVVLGLLTFPLLKIQPLRGVGVGLAGKGEWWEVGRNCLSGRYEASGGVWCSRLAKEGGLNGENNWIRLQ
jgi:hypothetical protein